QIHRYSARQTDAKIQQRAWYRGRQQDTDHLLVRALLDDLAAEQQGANQCLSKAHFAAAGIRHGEAAPVAPRAVQEQYRQWALRVSTARKGLRAQSHYRLPHLE